MGHKANFKVGDYVTFYNSALYHKYCGIESEEYDDWLDNEIEGITSTGEYTFADFPGTWPESIIQGLSPDQRKETND